MRAATKAELDGLKAKYPGVDPMGYLAGEVISGNVQKFVRTGSMSLSLDIPAPPSEVDVLRARVSELEAEVAALKVPKSAKAEPKG